VTVDKRCVSVVSKRGNFAISHWLEVSPLQHWSHYRVIQASPRRQCNTDRTFFLLKLSNFFLFQISTLSVQFKLYWYFSYKCDLSGVHLGNFVAKFRRAPLNRSTKRWCIKKTLFDQYIAISRKRYKTGPVTYRGTPIGGTCTQSVELVLFPMTLTDP